MDETLTDIPGHHVMSLLCKYMPYKLSEGCSWDEEKDSIADHILDYVERFFPKLREHLVGYQCLTPLDIERMLGMTRGDICHGGHEWRARTRAGDESGGDCGGRNGSGQSRGAGTLRRYDSEAESRRHFVGHEEAP